MRAFDYVTILFSILLGVCITQMATNIVLVIQNFSHSVLYAPPILWNAAALVAILAHWVHFFKARNREQWSALQLTVVFITPLIYFIPATLLARAPVIDGKLDYEVLFESNRPLIYTTVLLFAAFTMAQYYLVYESREKYIFVYYSLVVLVVVVALLLESRIFDQVLAAVVFVSEVMNHYVIRPIRLP
jgi:hypothetical protein